MTEQVGKALHNGETETKAFAPIACGIVELMEFVKDRLKFQFRDAGAGIPDFDADVAPVPAAAKQKCALAGVLRRVRHQIAQDLLEKSGIAAYDEAARHHTPVETAGRRVIRELSRELVEKALDRKIDNRRTHVPDFELVDVEQLVEHARHRAHRLVEPVHESERCLIVNALFQHPLEQRDGLQGMPQIMTGGSEKARFADVGPFRFRLRGLQCFALALDLGDVIDRHQDLPPR